MCIFKLRIEEADFETCGWGGGYMVVATKFNVKHQGKDIHHPPSIIYKWPLSDLPGSTPCPSLSLSFTKMFWARLQCCFIYHRSLLHVCKRKLQKNKIHLFPMRSGISDTANYLLSVVIFCWLPPCDHEGAGLSTSHLRIEISVSANHLQSKEKWC